MKKGILITLISFITVLSLTACAGLSSPAVNLTSGNVRTVTANGTGVVYVVPDVAYINIGVRVDDEVVSAALEKNNAQANAISKALQAQGVAENDIQTANFYVYPSMDYGIDGTITRNYYIVENTVVVTVRNLEDLGSLLDTVVRSGANTINNINFGLLDPSAAEAEARDLAIASAQAEAKAIASAAGVQLGALNSVNVNSSSVGTPYYDGMMGGGGMMDYSSEVPIAAGQLKISITANVVYEIK